MAAGNGTPNVGGANGGSADVTNPIDYAKMTDDDILNADDAAGDGADAGDESDEADEAEGDQAADGEEGQGDDAAEGEESDAADESEKEEEGEEGAAGDDEDPATQTLTEAIEPDNLKPFFSMKGGKAVRDLFYRHHQYSELFPNIKEARDIKEKFPTIEDVNHAVESTETLEKMDGLYFSEKPEDLIAFGTELHNQDPEAFKRLGQQWPDLQYQLDPAGYKADTRDRITGVLQNLLAKATKANNVNAKNAVDVIAMELFGKVASELPTREQRQAAPDPREADLSARERRLQESQAAAETARFTEFKDRANAYTVQRVEEIITNQLTNTLKGSAFAKNKDAQTKMGSEIWSNIDRTMKANRDLSAQLRRVLKDPQGKRDDAHRDRAAELILQRVRRLVRNETASVVSNWTKLLTANSAERIRGQQAQGKRPDITGRGTPGEVRRNAGKAISGKDIDYSKTSDDDILEDRVTVRQRK